MGGNEVVEGRLRGLVASLERPVEDAGGPRAPDQGGGFQRLGEEAHVRLTAGPAVLGRALVGPGLAGQPQLLLALLADAAQVSQEVTAEARRTR